MKQENYPGRRFTLAIRPGHVKAAARQLVLWTLAYFILLSMFSGSSEWQRIDYIYTAIFTITLMAAVAVNAGLIMPNFLNRKKYGIYILLAVSNIIAFTYFNHILFDKLIDYILPGYYFISYYEFADLLKFFTSFIVLTTLLQLSLEWFRLQETNQKLILLEKEKASAELQTLTSQVNPHFLFNSLSVLYSLALKESPETPQAIIQLSDILRYSIYESSSGTVPLTSEISLIRNYISLQQYRIHPSTKVVFDTDVESGDVQIASMLLLPLVENSFKHGVHGNTENGSVNIRLQTSNGQIDFVITNTRSINANPESVGGIGLKNIASRLRLIYGDRHTFTVSEANEDFTVSLQIRTNP